MRKFKRNCQRGFAVLLLQVVCMTTALIGTFSDGTSQVEEGRNLIQNGSFEDIRQVDKFTLAQDWFVAHWYQPQEADTVPIRDDYITKEDALDGKRSLILRRADPNDANAGIVHSRQIKLHPLSLYTFSLAYSAKQIRGAGDVVVHFFDLQGNLLPESVRLIFDAQGLAQKEGTAVRGAVEVEDLARGWKRLSVDFSAPAKESFAIVCLRLSHSSPPNGFVILDDVRITLKRTAKREPLPNFPFVQAKRIKQPPKIDGKLDEQAWRTAARVTDFVDYRTGKRAKVQTFARICYDDRMIYIAFECIEPHITKVKPIKRERDSMDIFRDESVEVFIDPEYSRNHYFQFAVNADGDLYDAEGFDSSWNSGAQVATSFGDQAWFVELAIPFESVAITPDVVNLWGLNLNRNRHVGEKTEHTCWSCTYGGFHRPDRFGSVEIPDVDFTRFVKLRPRQLLARNDRYLAFAESSLEKVSATEWFEVPSSLQPDVHLYAAKGEWESVQIVLRPREALEGVRIKVDDLLGKEGKLPAKNVTVYLEGYPNPDTTIPDILKPLGDGFNCPANRNTCLWVDIWVPREIRSGTYVGKLYISPQNAPSASVRLFVHVFNFTLPKRLRFRTGLFSIWHHVARWFEIPIGHPTYEGLVELTPEYEAVLKRLCELYVLNRISPGEPTLKTWRDLTVAKQSPIEQEFVKHFERWASYWLENGLYINNVERYGNPTLTDEEFYDFWYRYLKGKGWLDFAYTRGPNDERVDPKDPLTQQNIEWGKFVGKIAPNFKRLQTVPTRDVEHLKAFVGACDIWCLTPEQHLRISEIKQFLDERARQGEEVWWYIHEFLWGFRDRALRHRIFFWLAMRHWDEGVKGCILWATTNWNEDPRSYPMGAMKKLPDGSGIIVTPTADGILFYPGPNRQIYQALRIKMVRDGLEDMEYYLLLKDRLSDAERKGDAKTAQRIRQALKLLDRVVIRYGDYTNDADQLLRVRLDWGRVLSDLSR